MKVLYYNWIDNLDPERRGGGVAVYQRNVMEALAQRRDVEAFYLSAGVSYYLFKTQPCWRKVQHSKVPNEGNRFEIVNSAALAPAHMSFGNPGQIEHRETAEVFYDFIEAHGPFDVVHFNNLEGIPAEVLQLKERWPQTRVVLSLHNYYPFCPQVNLWRREAEHCSDFEGGHACRSCVMHKPDERTVRLAGAVAYTLKRSGFGPGSMVFDRGFRNFTRLARRLVRTYGRFKREDLPHDDMNPATRSEGNAVELHRSAEYPLLPTKASDFATRRERMRELINANCDAVLGVSDRVSGIAHKYGVDASLIRTSYIGTKQFERFAQTSPRDSLCDENGILTLGYLGYMRRDKGFFFLMEALEALPEDIAARIRLVIAAPHVPGGLETLRKISERFDSVTYADGYSHDSLDEILDPVTLGVVPNLWEDNLPQVAIEMHARHIPLLTSSRGGGQELGNMSEMVFTSGDAQSFADRLEAVLNGDVDLSAYWAGARPPTSMTQHLDEILEIYRQPAKQGVESVS